MSVPRCDLGYNRHFHNKPSRFYRAVSFCFALQRMLSLREVRDRKAFGVRQHAAASAPQFSLITSH